jgi:hypothetical protein
MMLAAASCCWQLQRVWTQTIRQQQQQREMVRHIVRCIHRRLSWKMEDLYRCQLLLLLLLLGRRCRL